MSAADRVLRVGWQDVDAVLTRQRKHIGAAGDQRLLVGQADVLARLDGRHRWLQTRAPCCAHLPAQYVSRNYLCICQACTWATKKVSKDAILIAVQACAKSSQEVAISGA